MGTKFKIIMTLAGTLFIAMLLMSLVLLYLSQRFLFQSDTHKAMLLTKMIAAHYFIENDLADGKFNDGFLEKSCSILENGACLGLLIINRRYEEKYVTCDDPLLLKQLKTSAHNAMKKKKSEESFCGDTWGAFWTQPQVYIIGEPIFRVQEIYGAISIAFSLNPAIRHIRKIQQIAGLYLIINSLLFTAIGFFRLYHYTVKPIQKIIFRATEYRRGDGPFLFYEGGGGDWETLYREVNRIVDLNSEDNEKLKKTVHSLKKAMADLKLAQQEIIRAEKLATVGRLSSGIAHEIGNPIGIVLGYLELMKKGVLSQEEVEDIILRTEHEIKRIDQIIRQLLDYSRQEKKELATVSAHEIVSGIIEMIRLQPVFSNVDMRIELNAEKDRVLADFNQLHQAALNIILNAVDAIDEIREERKGEITISSCNTYSDNPEKKCQHFFTLSFKDNGEGIDDESIDRIFEPFYTTKPPGKGNGLGLWVSMMIVDGIGGKLMVYSRVGMGTTVSMSLPVVNDNCGALKIERQR